MALKDELEGQARQLENEQSDKKKEQALLNKRILPRKRNPNGFSAMLRLMTGQNPDEQVWITLLTLIAGITLGYVMYVEFHWLVTIPFFALACISPITLIVGIIRYPFYRNWQEKQLFRVEGDFAQLAMDTNNSEYWWACQVILHSEYPNEETRSILHSAVRIFAVIANKTMYNTKFGKIERWKAHDNKAVGEANARTAWKLYLFISGELTRLHKLGVPLKSVMVQLSGSPRKVSAEIDTMS